MTKAYAYVRYSRAVQRMGDSEDRQSNALELFESTYGVKIAEIFYDRGKSAFRGDNARTGNFAIVMRRIQEGDLKPGDFLVVESIDRITRQRVLDGVELLQSILKAGVNIYTTSDQKLYSYSDPSKDFENLLMISVIAKRANEESETKSKRLLSSWRSRRKKAEAGEIIIKKGNSIPYGLAVENNKFVIVKKEQQEIQYLFESLITYGMNTAIAKLNEKSEKKWNNGTLNKILTNKTVIGCMAVHKVEHAPDGTSKKILTGYIEDYYPKLIEPSLFYAAINAMRDRKSKNHSGRRSEQDFNIFRNTIYCINCGGKMYYDHRGSRYKGKIYPHFRCDSARVQRHLCSASNVRFEYVLGLFLSCIESIKKVDRDFKDVDMKGVSTNQKLLKRDIDKLLIPTKQTGPEKELEAKLNELAMCRTRMDNLNASIAELDYKIPTVIMKQLSELEIRIDELNREIELLSADNKDIEIDLRPHAILDLFKTSEGRADLNMFFKQQGLSFYVGLDKSTRKSSMKIIKANSENGEQISYITKQFPLKNILHEFGQSNLQDMFDLSVK